MKRNSLVSLKHYFVPYVREITAWKTRREPELARKEKLKMDDEHAKMKIKIRSDIDLVKRKLRDERNEKRQQMQMDQAKNKLVRKLSSYGVIFVSSVELS